jgi:DnaJ-domain-containing protein 1
MGFDPRRWRPGDPPPRDPGVPRQTVTSNVDTLLAENDALRREVRGLRQELERLRRQRQTPAQDGWPGAHSRVSSSTSPGLTAALVERWGQAMARHPRWRELRLGPPGGLRGLIEAQRRRWWNPQLELEQELDRHSPGLGSELAAALRGPQSRSRWAVRAAFALYGPRAVEWLEEAPLRVVEDLLRGIGPGEPRRRSGTRTENHTQAGPGQRAGGRGGAGGAGGGGGGGGDPRSEALRLLGLEPGAGLAAIKRAYRRLAKAHHPDLGGEAEAFHRLDAAYRLLIRP